MELGIDVPVSLSMKLGDPNSLFSRMVSTAENPHLSIPETESGRRSKNIRQVVNNSLVFVSGSSSSSPRKSLFGESHLNNISLLQWVQLLDLLDWRLTVLIPLGRMLEDLRFL